MKTFHFKSCLQSLKPCLLGILITLSSGTSEGQDYLILKDSSVLEMKVIKVYSSTNIRIVEKRAEYDITDADYRMLIRENRGSRPKGKATLKLMDGGEISGFIAYGDCTSLMLWTGDAHYVPRQPSNLSGRIPYELIKEIKFDYKGNIGNRILIGFASGIAAGYISGIIIPGLLSDPYSSSVTKIPGSEHPDFASGFEAVL